MTDDVEKTEQTEEQTPEVDETKAELERTRAALKAANKEAADRRKRLEELEKKETERQQAEMTELDKAKQDAEQARQEAEQARKDARETLIRAAFVSEAAKQGAAYPEDVFRLADASGVEVQEDGTVTGVAEVVKGLVDSGRVPLQGKIPAPNLDGGAGGVDRPGDQTRLSPLEQDMAKNMRLTAEQYQKQKAVISGDDYQARKAIATG